MLYEIKENNLPDWFNKVPWYNIDICSKLRRKLFEYFIKNARTDRYNFMCYIIAHDKQQPFYDDEESSIGGIPIPENATTEALEALGDTLNFIDCWLELFHKNYRKRYMMYHEAMKTFFKKIPTMK